METGDNGRSQPPLPRTERPDAPLYLARYLARKAKEERGAPPHEGEGNDDAERLPLYLRRFRERRVDPAPLDGPPPLGSGATGAAATWAPKWAEVARSKEIVAPPGARAEIAAVIHIIRHGETQGYSTESGLTPMGGWQAHRRGFDLSKGVKEGERVRIVCADTSRARQTAEHIHRGMLDGLEQWDRRAEVTPPEPIPELANFRVATPSGLRDVTAAFREYHAVMERYERVALGDRPLWLVEIDRFWRTQQGGADPIHHWLTIPMLHFEPPVACVRRFWAAFSRLVEESPGAHIVAATHSGPIRAFAMWAAGYDPGEPYNVEEVVVQVKAGAKEALVAYRNRVQEVHFPPLSELPDWGAVSEPAGEAPLPAPQP